MSEVSETTDVKSGRGLNRLPLVVYGSSALGNLFRALPDEHKIDIVRAWLSTGDQPAVIDSAGKYGAGMALEVLGTCLRRLDAPADSVRIGVKLGWRRVPLTTDEPTFESGAWVGLTHDAEQCISASGIRACYEQSLELLGEPYRPGMVSVHDPDEYLDAASDKADREKRLSDVLEAYQELAKIRETTPGGTIGVGTKDWRVAQQLDTEVALDWVMLANCVTAYTHEPAALEFIAGLAERGVPVINSGVFNAGFLVGGDYFDYRLPSATEDAALFRWREAFFALCERHDVAPSHACIRFGLSPPGVVSVALNTTNPDRVAENLRFASTALPRSFWDDARAAELISDDYTHV
ncbi:aldo/keto reductase [Botrimarina hoheduenensis]|uniref:D-threo-aldose 1-dehydrogenase n=1 Tax=Botrimarina hoheduenensis TaxID=2528000 RepID=A0A5C5VR72_9BACT|nr:aldo/keto reductase [Botrimarina hoheduenensis]TWT40650.1 D-threo-aldose 1-dehydrogenase [Botrimarina hoheduenensis]